MTVKNDGHFIYEEILEINLNPRIRKLSNQDYPNNKKINTLL